LTFWWFDHGHPDLFSIAAHADEHRQRVVIDANVFFDLESEGERDSEDSMALLADWVQANIELVVTKELLNEIDRQPSGEIRAKNHAALTRYAILNVEDSRFQQISMS